MKKLRWLFLAGILFAGGQVKCQSITISPLFIPLPDSIILNSVFQDSLTIYDKDSTTFSGKLYLKLSINGNTPFIYNGTAGITFNSTESNFDSLSSFNFGDSVNVGITIHFGTPEFSAGPSVVVIWPIAVIADSDTLAIMDSLTTDTIKIIQPAGIAGLLPGDVKVYSRDQELIITSDQQNILQHVRIFDVTGTLVIEQNLGSSNSIPMGRYSDGIYLAELTLTSGQQITYKIFKGK